jgi:hypothetical protein
MGSGAPSTSNPLRDLKSSGAGVNFGWNMSSGFGAVPYQDGGSGTSRGFKFPWVRKPLPMGTSIEGNFSPWGGFPFVNTSGPRGFFRGIRFGNFFFGGSTFSPGGNPFGGIFGSGRNHAPRSTTNSGGTHSPKTPQPSSSTNIEGPQGPSEKMKTSPPSQYSFTMLLFLTTLDLPDLSWLKNYPIFHDSSWLTMLSKIPSNIPKFYRKP